MSLGSAIGLETVDADFFGRVQVVTRFGKDRRDMARRTARVGGEETLPAARGIRIRSLSTELAGDIDLQGLLGLDESVSPAYREIRIKMDIEADCSDEELDDLLGFAQNHSPVCNTVCRPVPVVIERVAKR